MSLKQTIEADLKKAMLAKDEIAKDALRLAKADLLNREVELGRDLTDEESTAVLQKGVKSRRDAIDQFRAGGRMDAVAEEEKQLAVLERYLPKMLSEDETRAAITSVTSELGLSSKKDMGRLMKELKARFPGVDGRIASKVAGEVLK
ncbi:GatB/YqeY domain-containing protein [Sandaracinus amylolyticus]|uniref:Transamidase GatB domain protein n=1 Tax=Sandaracinus amylolyticus TaxID=927083 RepID=A0A0F6SI25_9BACT|nr:GatB/YqeY domain-containing protein [Sandaracinus amylolyticus]AKF11454.1 Transamidase GatB domain protein [Sandaracinus amylolyticus]